jgi:hypothetical protein
MVVGHNPIYFLLDAPAVFVVFVGHKRSAFAFSGDGDELIGFVPFILVLTVFGPLAVRIVRDSFIAETNQLIRLIIIGRGRRRLSILCFRNFLSTN